MPQWNVSNRARQRTGSTGTGHNSAAANVCLTVVDGALGLVIFVGPHLFGGRHLLGRFAIVSFCLAAALAWFVRQALLSRPSQKCSTGTMLLFAVASWVAFQLVPLPAEWLTTLSPRTAAALPLWTGSHASESLGKWDVISLSPEDTRLALATLIAYALLFVTVVQRHETLDDIKRLVRWIGCSAVIVALFGIVQYFTANGKFFWVYEHPYSETIGQFKAGFTSRNHFAHFLVLGLANLMTWSMICQNPQTGLVSRRRTQQNSASFLIRQGRVLRMAGSALVTFAIFASLSRGGVVAMLATVLVAAICYTQAGMLQIRQVTAVCLIGVALLAALSVAGNYDEVSKRLGTLTAQSLDKVDASGGRRQIWSANLAAFKAGKLCGSGAGTHRFVYPLYMEDPSTVEFTHAENGYLQVATENGIPGLILLATASMGCLGWCIRAIRHTREDLQVQILAGGCLAALVGSLCHSVVDFVWFIPACATITVIMGAIACRLCQLSKAQKVSSRMPVPSRLSRFNAAFAVGLASAWAVVTLWPAAVSSLEWDLYLLADQANQVGEARKLICSAEERQTIAESEKLNNHSVLVHLVNVVRDYPDCARAHLRLSGALINRFEQARLESDNAMTIGQIREAAQASQFKSPAELQGWLQTAFGNDSRLLYLARYHALRALALCPLQGEAYLYLAELCFLEGRDARATEAYCSQAMKVRPHDAEVQFTVGKHRLTAGLIDQALPLWSRSFRNAGKHRRMIVNVLAGNMTAGSFLAAFQPDWTSLEIVWDGFQAAGTPDDLQAIQQYASRQARQQVPLVSRGEGCLIYLELSRMQLALNDPRAALESLQQAYGICPDDFSVRYELGKVCLALDAPELAEPHLRWCVNQRPDNEIIRSYFIKASRAKVQRLARATTTSSL